MKYISILLLLTLTSCYTTPSEKLVYLQRKFTHSKVFAVPDDQSNNEYVVVQPCGQVLYVHIDDVDNDKSSAVEVSPCNQPAN